jgi:copper chaperone CopZ
MKSTIKVQNIKCDGCVATIVDNLLKLSGVEFVVASRENGTVDVTHIDVQTLNAVENRLAEIGYPKDYGKI